MPHLQEGTSSHLLPAALSLGPIPTQLMPDRGLHPQASRAGQPEHPTQQCTKCGSHNGSSLFESGGELAGCLGAGCHTYNLQHY